MKIIGYKSYVKILLFLIVLGMTFSVLRMFASVNFIRIYLLLIMFNNLWFILINAGKIKIRIWSQLLILLLLISFIKGLINHSFSDRIFLDIYKPVSFIFVFHLFSLMKISREDIKEGVKKASKVLFRTSVFFATISFILLSFFGGYAGMRLPILLSISYYAAHLKKGNVFVSIIAVLLSGKRAILLAVLPVLWIGFNFKFSVKKVAIFSVVIGFSFLLISSNWDTLKETKGFSKFTYTVETIAKYSETKDLQILNIVSAKRLQEITSGLYGFSTFDYLFGRGVGYTYDLYDIKRERIEKPDQGNIHFSPASLIASYGVLFMIIFYVFFTKHVRRGIKNAKKFENKTLLTLSLYSLAILIESFFAYALFVIPLLPVVLGLVSNELRYLKSKS